MATAQEHYSNGHLGAAIDALAEELRSDPSNARKRAFFTELLCLRGELDKADRQLDTLLKLDSDLVVTVGTWRQLIRAAQARRDVFDSGAVPEVIETPTERISALLDIHVALRNNELEQAAERSQALEDNREPMPMQVNGEPVDDARDLDDLCAGILEVLGTNGKYFWVDMNQLESLELSAPQRPLDLLWRKAQITLTTGTEGEVFIPMVYPTASDNEALQLGRETDWQDLNGLVRGVGHRLWLVGEDAVPFVEIDSLDTTANVARDAAAE